MTKLWSIATAVRNPERLIKFIELYNLLKGQNWDKELQKKYQILLIQHREYKPTTKRIPEKYRLKFKNSDSEITFEEAKETFYHAKYEDPPMRGRQSANPLIKLGFVYPNTKKRSVKLTALGEDFINDKINQENVFLLAFLKLQFPNPRDLEFKKNFKIIPFISFLKLLKKVNDTLEVKGITQDEFHYFVPSFQKYNQLDNILDNIKQYRASDNKKEYLYDFAKDFYKRDPTKTDLKNFIDYGDNTMRCFKLTNLFIISKSAILAKWRINFDPIKIKEVDMLLKNFNENGLIEFKDEEEYTKYLSSSDISIIPWQKKENLLEVIKFYLEEIENFSKKKELNIHDYFKNISISNLEDKQIKELIITKQKLKNTYINMKDYVNQGYMKFNLEKLAEFIEFLDDKKKLNSNKFKPYDFEKLGVDIFTVLNDSILIKGNYSVDDNGDPISHAKSGLPDFECRYENFNFIGEVTKQQSGDQWVTEGVPTLEHLYDFSKDDKKDKYLLFISPTIHLRSYAIFYTAIKGGPFGKQKVVPVSCKQFSSFLKYCYKFISKNKKFDSSIIKSFFSNIVDKADNTKDVFEWIKYIDAKLENYNVNEN